MTILDSTISANEVSGGNAGAGGRDGEGAGGDIYAAAGGDVLVDATTLDRLSDDDVFGVLTPCNRP